MKKIFIFFLFYHNPTLSFSQAIRPYKIIEIGSGVVVNRFAGDTELYKNTGALSFNLTYNADPYLNFIGEFQTGKLAGGDAFGTDTGREFENRFNSLAGRIQLQMGLLMHRTDNKIANALKSVTEELVSV